MKKILTKFSFLVLAILFVLINSSSVLAISDETLHRIYNDTSWYKPGTGGSGCTTTIVGSTFAEQAWNYFKSKGLSDVQAAAILGNFKEESGINPQRVEEGWGFPDEMDSVPPNVGPDGQPGYGIAQWTYPTRKDGLRNLASSTNRSPGSMDLQLDYTWQEMTDSSPNDVLEGLKSITGTDRAAIDNATRYFHTNFEASGDTEAGIQERVRAAIWFHDHYGGSTPVGDPNPGEPICSGAGPGEACATGAILGWQLDGECRMVSYDQGDPRWANHPYGTGKSALAESGCGPTSLAMVGATLLGDTSITPVTVADRYGNQYHVTGGTDWGLFPVYAQDTGLNFRDLGTDLNAAAETIRNGGLVVISVDPGHFTGGGHLMVIRAVSQDGSQFYLADPNGDGYSNDSETRSFSADFLRSTGAMKHLWGYSK